MVQLTCTWDLYTVAAPLKPPRTMVQYILTLVCINVSMYYPWFCYMIAERICARLWIEIHSHKVCMYVCRYIRMCVVCHPYM